MHQPLSHSPEQAAKRPSSNTACNRNRKSLGPPERNQKPCGLPWSSPFLALPAYDGPTPGKGHDAWRRRMAGHRFFPAAGGAFPRTESSSRCRNPARPGRRGGRSARHWPSLVPEPLGLGGEYLRRTPIDRPGRWHAAMACRFTSAAGLPPRPVRPRPAKLVAFVAPERSSRADPAPPAPVTRPGLPRRPPPAGAESVVNRCGGGWSASGRRAVRPPREPGPAAAHG